MMMCCVAWLLLLLHPLVCKSHPLQQCPISDLSFAPKYIYVCRGGETALMMAACRGLEWLVRLLVEHGADVNTVGPLVCR
jgi:hypothetical protein